jgi:hypothetical protein
VARETALQPSADDAIVSRRQHPDERLAVNGAQCQRVDHHREHGPEPRGIQMSPPEADLSGWIRELEELSNP